MDPYGHHNHNHHRRDERDEHYPPPPHFDPPPPPQPSFYSGEDYQPPPRSSHYPGEDYPPPPPPQSTHVYHSSHLPGGGPEYPPPSRVPDYYDPRRPEQPLPPPQVTHVQHVSHSSPSYGNAEIDEPHHHRPHVPSFIANHIHHQEGGSDLGGKPSVRVFSKAETNYSLTIRDGKVILVRSDPSDPLQHWIKDEKFSIRVKDEQGFPSFALVNKATGQAIKHSIGATHPVQLIPYNPDVLDESVLWTESKDLGDGYRTIRMVNNIRLNFDAYDGNKNRGGVHDGTTIVLWEWGKGENQRWRIVPY